MTYEIKPYSFYKAELLGVKIKPSTCPKYKIDVFSHDRLQAFWPQLRLWENLTATRIGQSIFC